MNKIPRIIHQIWWQGMDKLPKKYQRFKESWVEHHPGWKIMYWDKIKYYWNNLKPTFQKFLIGVGIILVIVIISNIF